MESILNRFNPIKIEHHAGEAIQAGDRTITPYSRSVRFQLPFRKVRFGVVWNRPVAVTVDTGGEEIQRFPVVDGTRQVQVLIWISALFLVMIFRLLIRTRRTE